jgi:hypothetical protein
MLIEDVQGKNLRDVSTPNPISKDQYNALCECLKNQLPHGPFDHFNDFKNVKCC